MSSVGDDALRAFAKLPPLSPDAPDPQRFANTKPLENAFHAADFRDLHREPINVYFDFASPKSFAEQLKELGFRAVLPKQSLELQEQILAAAAEGTPKYADASGRVHMDNEAIILAAHT